MKEEESTTPVPGLVAVGKCTFAPFEFADPETGKVTGFYGIAMRKQDKDKHELVKSLPK